MHFVALPQIAAQPEAKEVTVGSDAILPCIASGYPVPTIIWSKVTLMFHGLTRPNFLPKPICSHSSILQLSVLFRVLNMVQKVILCPHLTGGE